MEKSHFHHHNSLFVFIQFPVPSSSHSCLKLKNYQFQCWWLPHHSVSATSCHQKEKEKLIKLKEFRKVFAYFWLKKAIHFNNNMNKHIYYSKYCQSEAMTFAHLSGSMRPLASVHVTSNFPAFGSFPLPSSIRKQLIHTNAGYSSNNLSNSSCLNFFSRSLRSLSSVSKSPLFNRANHCKHTF